MGPGAKNVAVREETGARTACTSVSVLMVASVMQCLVTVPVQLGTLGHCVRRSVGDRPGELDAVSRVRDVRPVTTVIT